MEAQQYTGQLIVLDQNGSPRAVRCTLDENGQALLKVSSENTNIIQGTATNGSYGMLVDDTKYFESNILVNKTIEITIDDIVYRQIVSTNTENQIIFSPLGLPEQAFVVNGDFNIGQITIFYHDFGAEGNNYSVEFIKNETDGIPTVAELNGYLLTVKLEVNDQNEVIAMGADTAQVISLLPEFEAQMTGQGGLVALTNEPISFSGGSNGITVLPGSSYEIKFYEIVEEIRQMLDLNGTYSYMTMTLSGNPDESQIIGFGDSSIPFSGEYTHDINTYAGMDVPILIGANPSETQANTVIAFNEYQGEKPNVTVTSQGNILIVTSNIMGSTGFVGIGPPAVVGSTSELYVGEDTVSLRNLTVKIAGNTLVEQLTHADAVEDILTFNNNITAIEIYHNEATWHLFAVNGLTLTVPPGGYRSAVGGTVGSTVTIPANVNCIVGRLI